MTMYADLMRSFFTDGTHAVTVPSLVDFLSYKKNQQKKKLHAQDNEKTLSDLMKSIRFVAHKSPEPKNARAILEALHQEYDQQNTLTARFLHHLRDV
jgi:hypothetical protein